MMIKLLFIIFCLFSLLFLQGPILANCPEVLTSIVNRDAFISGFKKQGLNVNWFLNFEQKQDVTTNLRLKFGEERQASILNRLAGTRVFRDMEIVGGIRGNATTVKITLKDKEGNVLLERNAKGDPRTEEGKQNIATNVQIAITELRNKLITNFSVSQ